MSAVAQGRPTNQRSPPAFPKRDLDLFAQICCSYFHIWDIIELEVLFWSVMGLLRRKGGVHLRTSGTVSAQKFQWRGLETLVNMKAMLLTKTRRK